MRITDALVVTGADREVGHGSYTTTLLVDQGPEQAFDAINERSGMVVRRHRGMHRQSRRVVHVPRQGHP